MAVALALLAGAAVVGALALDTRGSAAQQQSGTPLLGEAPKEIRSVAEMDGSPQLLWSVLTDLPRYPVWNPFFSPVEGELRPGNTLQVTMHSGARAGTYEAVVLQVETDRVLSWSGKVFSAGVYDVVYSFTIESIGPRRVRLVSREARSGLAPVVEWILGSDIQAGLDAMTRSARNRVELLNQSGGTLWPPTLYHLDERSRGGSSP